MSIFNIEDAVSRRKRRAACERFQNCGAPPPAAAAAQIAPAQREVKTELEPLSRTLGPSSPQSIMKGRLVAAICLL